MKDKRYLALLQERADLIAESNAIFAAAGTSGLTDEQKTRDDAIAARLEALAGELARIERNQAHNLAVAQTPNADAATEGKTTTQATPFRSLGEQLVAVWRSAQPGARPDERLLGIQAAAGLNESVDAEGGFLVQQDFVSGLIKNVWDAGALASRARRRTISSGANGIRLNAIDETSRADGQRAGGIQAFWTGEAQQKTASQPRFRRIALDLEKLTGVYYATDELLMDATALEQEVESWFTDEFGFKLDDAILRGTGAGMPLGILGHPALVTQAAEGGQAVDTVVAANIQKMFARMLPRSLSNAVWFINQEVWPHLFAMNQANMPVFMPGGSLAGAPFGTLLGRPIVPLEQASAIGDVGDIMLLDLDQYLLIEKGGIESASSIHVRFLTDETTFRFVMRVNGQPIPSSAITPYKGAATLSPFVTLAAR